MLSANVLVIMGGAAMIVVILMGRANGTSGPTILARCGLLAAIGWILALTIFPIPVEAHGWRFHRLFSNMHFLPFGTIRAQLASGLEYSEARQLIGNVVLFIPFGFLLPAAVRACRRLWVTLLAAAGLSFLIETMQAILPEHATDVDDVILNTTGAALGYLAFWVIAWTARQPTARDEGTLREPAPSSAG
jgi:glycopeptide antibiotics resistance protein